LAPTVGIAATGFCYPGGILQLFLSTRSRNFTTTNSSRSRIIIFNIQIASGWDALIFDGKSKHQRLRYREADPGDIPRLRSGLIRLEVVRQVPRKSHQGNRQSKQKMRQISAGSKEQRASRSVTINHVSRKEKKREEARADKQAATQDRIPRNKSREEVATGFDQNLLPIFKD
jgi:hypothetical protein